MSISFASPPWRIRSFRPLSCSNAAFTSFEIANESWVTSTTSSGVRASAAARSERGRAPTTAATPADDFATHCCKRPHARLLRRDGSQGGRLSSSATRASVPVKTFETPRVGPGSRVSPAQRILEALGHHAHGRTADAGEGEQLAAGAGQRSLPAHDMDERVADERVELEPGIALRAEQEQEQAEQMVEAPCRARDDQHAARTERGGLVERELEIGCVLRGRVPHDARAGRLGGGERLWRHRVQVADDDVHVEAERSGAQQAAVRRDDALRVREASTRAPPPRRRPRHRDQSRPFLRWHYPDQVLRVGGASAALSARSLRAPRFVLRY